MKDSQTLREHVEQMQQKNASTIFLHDQIPAQARAKHTPDRAAKWADG